MARINSGRKGQRDAEETKGKAADATSHFPAVYLAIVVVYTLWVRSDAGVSFLHTLWARNESAPHTCAVLTFVITMVVWHG